MNTNPRHLVDKLSKKDIQGTTTLLIFPSQMQRCFIVKVVNVKYNITITKDSIINYISTSDNHFKTNEGIDVGSSLSRFKNKKNITWKGWGKFIKLNSGWNAVFNDGVLNNNSKVLFFLKFDKKFGKTINNKNFKITL